MEGLEMDSTVLKLMQRFEQGELDRQQFSQAMDAHAAELLAKLDSVRQLSVTDAA